MSRLCLAFVLLSLAGLTACTSFFTRRDCAKIDWYDFGKQVALSGNRLSGNAGVRRCEEADAPINYSALDQGFKLGMETYCLPETVSAIGKRGEYFSAEMCDGEHVRLLRQRHSEGVQSYCQKNNGYAAGAVGKPYNQICPKELESAFMPEFNRGRRTFLAASISQLDGEISDSESNMRSLEFQRQSQWAQYVSMPTGSTIRHQTVYDPITRTYMDQPIVEEDQNLRFQRDNLYSQVQGTDAQIGSQREKINSLRDKRRKLNAELSTL